MANCKVVTGINNVCGDLLQASGLDKDFWVGYVSDLGARFSLTQSAAIGSISFVAYAGLVKFEGQKYTHSYTVEEVKGAGGSLSYKHGFNAKLMRLSTTDDVEFQRLTQAQDMFIIFQDNNESFFILGPSKGMMSIAGPIGGSGVAAGEDTTSSVSFEGNEKVLPLRFSLGTTTSAIITYLDSLVR